MIKWGLLSAITLISLYVDIRVGGIVFCTIGLVTALKSK